MKKRLVGFIGLVAMLSIVTIVALLDFSMESKTKNTQKPPLNTQFSYTLSESTPILAVIPFSRLSYSLHYFNCKSGKNAHSSLFRERLLEQRYANTPGQYEKRVALFVTYSKSYFVYNLREIIV